MSNVELYRQARSPKSWERVDAVSALGKAGDRNALPVLAHAVHDEDSDVRRAACMALGRIGGERAVPPLLYAAKDPVLAVRGSAVGALAELGDPRAVPVLVRALLDYSGWVRGLAVSALERIGDQRALQALMLILTNPDFSDLGDAAGDAMVQIAGRDSSSVRVLNQMLPELRRKIAAIKASAIYPAQVRDPAVDRMASVLKRLEALLPLNGLPIPARTQQPAGQDLPRVAAPPDPPADDLPIPGSR